MGMIRRVVLPVAIAATVLAGVAEAQRGGGRGGASRFVSVDTNHLALTNVRVIDGTGAPARANQTVIVRDGNIVAVGDAARTPVPAGAQVMDLTGKSLIPGLVMVHEHLYYPSSGGTYGNYSQSFPILYLAGGVTSMRTGGNTNGYGELAAARAVNEGRQTGPWIDATAPYLQMAGMNIAQMHSLKDADEARRMVNFWADAGATSFKAYMHISRDVLRAAIEEVHKRGLRITGHLCSVTYREAAEMGIDNLEHGFFASTDFVANKRPDVCPGQRDGQQTIRGLTPDDERFKSLVAELVRRNVALTSTLAVFETFTPGRPLPPGLDVLTPQLREVYEGRHANTQRSTNSIYSELYPKAAALEVAFSRAGGLLVAGTDPTGGGGVIPGYSNQRTVELLVEAGFTPLEAIRICTLNGAIYLRRDDRVGSIVAGKQADLVVIGGDPSTTVSDIRKVEIVFRNGVGYDPEALVASVRGLVGLY
jgi:enamidase